MLPINKQLLSLALLIVLLSATILMAVNNGKNDINKYLLQEHLNYWVQDNSGKEKEWNKVQQYFEHAQSSFVTDPDTLAYGARLYEWAMILRNRDSTHKEIDKNTVDDIYIDSILVRPLWPHSWKDLTLSLSNEGNYGEKFQTSFRNTILLGHQEDRVQVELSDLGLHQWSNLTVDNRKLFIPFLSESARKRAVELTRLKHSKMSKLILCNAIKDNSIVTTYCDK